MCLGPSISDRRFTSVSSGSWSPAWRTLIRSNCVEDRTASRHFNSDCSTASDLASVRDIAIKMICKNACPAEQAFRLQRSGFNASACASPWMERGRMSRVSADICYSYISGFHQSLSCALLISILLQFHRVHGYVRQIQISEARC